jgi:hypothetical protein
MMSKNIKITKYEVDYTQFPDSSIPVYYSTSKGYITYTGQIIPHHCQNKVYLMTPKQASKVLDLIPYQEYLNGDITKEDKFIHKEYGKKINFSKLNNAVFTTLKHETGKDRDIFTIFNKLLKNFPYTITEKTKKIIEKEKEEERFKTELKYRFDLDYDN